MNATLPIDEKKRLAALQGYDILDTDPEQSFDDITLLASQICDTPTASITLVDENRQWFKSKVGLAANETPRDIAFCAQTILQEDLLEVQDAQADERFASNPLVTGDPPIRFYAGYPLVVADGHALGALCVIDRVPRHLTTEQKTALRVLAHQVIVQLELRRSLKAKINGEAQLRASELGYRRLFEAAKDGILILDVDTGRITDVNPFLAEVLGFSRSDMIGKTVGELSPFKDIESNKIMLERLQSHGYVRYEDLPLKTSDGRHIAVEFVCNVYPVGEKKVIQCNVRDITARKIADERMVLLNTCVSNLNDIVLVTEVEPIDEPGPRIVFVNDAFERITGYTSAEALGRNPRFLQGEKTDPQALADIHQALTQRLPIRRQVVNYRKDGTEYWMDIDIVPVLNAAGKCTHFAAIERDITESKTLKESLNLFRILMDGSSDAIEVIDPNSGRFLDVNKTAFTRLGYSREEMLGLSLPDVIEGGESPFSMQAVTEEVRKTGFRILESRHRRKDGSTFPVEINVQHVDLDQGYLVAVVRDITDRKQQEVALRKSEERFRSYFELGQIGMTISSPAKELLEVNNKLCQVLGYDRDELLQKTWAEMTHPDDLAADVTNFNQVLAGECDGYSMNKRFLRRDGKVIDAFISVSCVRSANGEVDYLIGMVQDITAHRKTEDTLRESEAKFHTLFEVANDANFILYNGVFVDCNARAEELFGVAREQLIGQSPSLISPPVQPDGRDSQDKAMELLQGALAGRPQSFEWMNQRLDGTSIYADVSLNRFELMGKIYIQAIVRDITQRKQAEEQIAEQATFLDLAQDAIFVRDLGGKMLFWNKGAERMYGWTRQEVVDRNVDELLYTHPKKLKEAYALTTKAGEWHGELEHLTKNGSNLVIESRWTLVRDSQGHPKSVLAINTDITEKKNIQAQFMRAQRMESIGTLAGGIAHDLNNILAPIMMAIEILKEDLTNPQSAKILQTIEVSAKRGADIVRQVLSFARGMEGERLEIQPKHLLNDLESIIKGTFPKDIRLQFSVPNDTWTILGDPTQVHQILLNLCVNARDAMPNGGNLTVEVQNSVLDDQYVAMNLQAKAGRYVNITVTDTGVGMSPAVVDKIFEPFFTTKELNKGTGLGLSTVMGIVKSHGGVINVYSEPGKGTAFNVYLPALEISTEARRELAEEASLPRGNGETVLIVDDEASILIITSQTLQAFGYRVLTATDGAEAVAIYAQHRHEIAVVLTDMMMPVMDGTATIRALTKIDPAVKIIAASGVHANGSVDRISGTVVKHFLTKPYTAGTLLKVMRTILDEA